MIYFIQEALTGNIKIGFAEENVEQRISDLQCGNSSELTLLGVVAGSVREEQQLHKLFTDYRIRGEWFKPAPALIQYITVMVPGSKIPKPAAEVRRPHVAVNPKPLTPQQVQALTPEKPSQERYVSDRELQELTPYKRSMWQQMRCKGGGPPYYKTRGGKIIYKLSEVFAWIESERLESTSQEARRPSP
jgi:hypothetical protein